jgi:hypothetical protein
MRHIGWHIGSRTTRRTPAAAELAIQSSKGGLTCEAGLNQALERPGYATVLPDPPEMDGHEDDDDERKQKDVKYVPSQQRR